MEAETTETPEISETPKQSNRFFIIVGALGSVVLALLLLWPEPQNPLIGTWKIEQKLPLPEQTIKFTPEQVSSMGVTEKVTYAFDGNAVTVIDKEGRGFVYTVIDEQTIESNFAGMKMRYLRKAE